MELQVQELLERIKSEGVDAARTEADRIVSTAEGKAKAILGEAEKNAAGFEAVAKARVEAMEKASRLALVQASRDTILALREKVQSFMRDAIHSTVSDVMDSAFMGKILPELLISMARETQGDLTVLLPPKTLEALDGALANRLAKELGRGVQFKPFGGVDAGFRVAVENSAAHYDFSAESVAAILASRVNARLAECVMASIAEGKLS